MPDTYDPKEGIPILKKFALFLLAAAVTLTPLSRVAHAAAEPELAAEAAVLMDADSGQILYAKAADRQMAPASLTKLLTALVALEELDPAGRVTVSEEAVDLPAWGSSADLEAGEELTVDDVLYALMLPSANEAANVLAEAVDGSEEAFVERLNARAAALGADNTHFENAHGLPARRHYTTARDLATITRAALETPGFLDYFGAAFHTLPATDLSPERTLGHTHRMLRPDREEYDPTVIGGKTGYTMQAGYTLATVARRDGRTLIAIVLHSDEFYADTRKLFDYGFSNFSPAVVPVEGAGLMTLGKTEEGVGSVEAVCEVPDQLELLLPQGLTLSDLTVEVESSLDSPSQQQSSAELVVYAGGEEFFSQMLGFLSWSAELESAAPVLAEGVSPGDAAAVAGAFGVMAVVSVLGYRRRCRV